MKTDKNFRLNQPAKRMLALIDEKSEYTFYKNVFIENQIQKNRAKQSRIKEKGDE